MIALDLDNTVVDATLGVQLVLARRLNIRADELSWHPSYTWPVLPRGMRLEQLPERRPCEIQDTGDVGAVIRAYQNLWDNPEINLEFPSVDGAAALSHELKQDGLLSGYVTRRPESLALVSAAWLRRNGFPEAPLRCAGSGCKSLQMHSINARILLDDHNREVSSVRQSGLEAVLISHLHNSGETNEGSWRARDFAEAVQVARGIAAALKIHEKPPIQSAGATLA